MKEIKLRTAVDIAIANAGGVRALARLIGVSPGHICHMRNGRYDKPSEKTCKAIGIKRIVKYYVIADNE